MRRELVFGLLSGAFSLSVAFAQTNVIQVTPTPVAHTPVTAVTTEATADKPIAPLATTQAVTTLELGVAERPGFFSLLGLRLQRLFSLSDIAKARVTERLAKTLLQQARIALAQGNTARAQALLSQYNQETTKASQLISSALSQVDTATNPAVAQLVAELEQAKIFEAAVVDEMSLKATGEFNNRLLKERAEIAKKLVKLLTKQALTPEELERKIAKLSAKLAEKEAKAQDKLAKRLATLDLLDQAADQEEDGEELDEAIGALEEDEIAALASQPTANLGTLISQIPGSTSKHLIVLQALLDRVPQAAKPTIDELLGKELEKAKAKLAAKQLELADLVDEDSAKHQAAKEKLLLRLEAKADERITKAIEKATKKLQQAQERRAKLRERLAKETPDEADEDELDELDEQNADDDDGDEATASPRPTTSPSPTSKTTPTATPEPKTHKIELEDDGFKTTSLTIAAGDSVSFEIKDEGNYLVRSGPHPAHTDLPELDSGVVSKGAKYSFKFSKTGTFRFHDHLHPSFTGTITVK